MKTIAAVTIAFLPGTYVAALFAMPLFQWNAETGIGLVSKHFWIYWATTVPLTILTVAIWIVWTKVMGNRHNVQDKIGREQLWKDIDDMEDDPLTEKRV